MITQGNTEKYTMTYLRNGFKEMAKVGRFDSGIETFVNEKLALEYRFSPDWLVSFPASWSTDRLVRDIANYMVSNGHGFYNGIFNMDVLRSIFPSLRLHPATITKILKTVK